MRPRPPPPPRPDLPTQTKNNRPEHASSAQTQATQHPAQWTNHLLSSRSARAARHQTLSLESAPGRPSRTGRARARLPSATSRPRQAAHYLGLLIHGLPKTLFAGERRDFGRQSAAVAASEARIERQQLPRTTSPLSKNAKAAQTPWPSTPARPARARTAAVETTRRAAARPAPLSRAAASALRRAPPIDRARLRPCRA